MPAYQGPVSDTAVRALARAVLAAPVDDEMRTVVVRSVVDSVGVALAGGTHPVGADMLARVAEWEESFGTASRTGATVWGTPGRVSAETAALLNGARLRCFDFNDLYFGPSRGVHPSDTLPVLTAVAEDTAASGRELLDAAAIAFKVQAVLCDRFLAPSSAADYTTLTAIGAVCGLGRLTGMDEVVLQHAISIVVTLGVPPSEMESGARNRHGLLTSWKRMNAAWAGIKALQAVKLARLGLEGPYHAFTGKRAGLFGILGMTAQDQDGLMADLEDLGAVRVPVVSHKSWPLGARGQAAVKAALDAAAPGRADGWVPERVDVTVTPGVYDHMVRFDGYLPVSMDGADHSVPVAVALAVLDGQVDTRSFLPASYERPALQDLLRDSVFVSPSRSVRSADGPDYGAAVEILWSNGETSRAESPDLPGYGRNALSDEQLSEKASAGAALVGQQDWFGAALPALWDLDRATDVSAILHQGA